MRTYKEIKNRLQGLYGEREAAAIGFLLLERHCGLGMTDVVMGKDEKLDADTVAQLHHMAQRIAEGEPVQYVLGTADFCGLSFNVTPGVLIPRPETEELVEWICHDHHDADNRQALHILDIGTGSGCIAVSLARRLAHAKVEAWDISEDALRIAKQNALMLGADVTFRQMDILAPPAETELPGKYSIVVSNPPYICEEERTDMEKNVLEHEPELALFVPDDNPLLFYRVIAEKAAKMLHTGGALYFEINRRFAHETEEVMRAAGFTHIETRRDFMENERMMKGILEKER